MHVYVIASSEHGPSKIGVAANPQKRLKALQTGSQITLSLFHVEPIGPAAAAVERAAHRALTDRRSNGEWFDVTPEQARVVIRTAAAAADVLINATATLSELGMRSTMQWLAEREKYERACEERDEDPDDFDDAGPPGVLELLGSTLRPPRSRFNFNLFTHLGRRNVASLGYGAIESKDAVRITPQTVHGIGQLS